MARKQAAARSAAPEEAARDTRERILTAALAAFAEHGFEGATTRGIASAAGVNLGLLQYHFGSKLKLWQAAVDLAFSELREGTDALLADPRITDDRERARRMIRNYVRFVARRPEFVLIMHDEGRRRGPRMRWLVDRHARPLFAAIRELAQLTARYGLLPPDTAPVHLYYVLAGAVGLIFHQAEECKRLTGVDPADPAVVEAHAAVVEHLLLGPPHQENVP